ncbi:MAG TPA: hypothetical protein VFM98_17690 [Ramlibacter sp.]|uniref:hypothetical protein n=1 Tax=Ramlibacter sp. TaxID=1917967 RepID=UPI002D80C5C7|nr:hypothetical protein [Ramlibacter sp.]HET8747437.1 hypothetical protein [Ramlibacter sp.]
MLRPLIALLLLAAPLAAQALCTSDDVAPVKTVVERFLRADCVDCWRTGAAAQPAADTLVLDWIVPAPQGEDAPLSAAESDAALERLAALRQRPPRSVATVTSRQEGQPVPVRIALGEAVNDYVGASIELPEGGREPWQAWLLLVERIPAGVEGTPLPRLLVRKVFRPEAWASAGRPAGPLAESRSMQLPASARPERLRLVAVVHDARGRIRAITQTECRD